MLPFGEGNSMNHRQFWQKATDYYDIYHGKYRRAVLTEEELRETVTDYIGDMMTLMGEWHSTKELNDDNKQNG